MSESVKKQLIDSAKINPKKIQVTPHPMYDNFGSIDKKNAKNIGISDKDIHGR